MPKEIDTRSFGLFHIEKLISQNQQIAKNIARHILITYAHYLYDDFPILKARASTLSEFVYCKRRALLLTLMENTPEIGEYQFFQKANPDPMDYTVMRGRILHNQKRVMSVILYDSVWKRQFGSLIIFGKPDKFRNLGDMIIIEEYKSNYSNYIVRKAFLQANIYAFIYSEKYPDTKIVIRIKTYDGKFDKVFNYDPNILLVSLANIHSTFIMGKNLENPLRCNGCHIQNLCVLVRKHIDNFAQKYGEEKLSKWRDKIPAVSMPNKELVASL